MSSEKILVINPGSTSTKIAIYYESKIIFLKNIKHSATELSEFEHITDQYGFRKNVIFNELEIKNVDLNSINAVIGRGGLIKPVKSGVIEVNETLINDLKNSPLGEHASNLGGLIAHDIANSIQGARAFIADPVVVDEFEDVARISGHPLFERKSIFHALNQKAVGRLHAKETGTIYEESNLIIVHLGGGITVGAHKRGRVIDVNNGLDAEGPMTPERSGTLPVGDVVNLCFSGEYSHQEIKNMLKGKGGLVAYLGTNSAIEVEDRISNGDKYAELIYEAMAYQVSKHIGSMIAVLKGQVDAILISGGIAFSKWFIDKIIDRVSSIAPVHVYPGEDEMAALATNAEMVLKGEAEVIKYD